VRAARRFPRESFDDGKRREKKKRSINYLRKNVKKMQKIFLSLFFKSQESSQIKKNGHFSLQREEKQFKISLSRREKKEDKEEEEEEGKEAKRRGGEVNLKKKMMMR
jgi:hypothetical protein